MAKIEGSVAVPLKEITNNSQAYSGTETPKKPGPARGKTFGNPTKRGGISRPAESGNAPRG